MYLLSPSVHIVPLDVRILHVLQYKLFFSNLRFPLTESKIFLPHKKLMYKFAYKLRNKINCNSSSQQH